MSITVTDLFCGGGGSTLGALQVPGVDVVMAANHARHCVDTHQANHPEVDHDCADLSQVDPRRYPSTDVLWASPECTHHTRAQGRRRGHGDYSGGLFAADGADETAIRSRATMWDVARFTEHHRYKAIIVENVVDARWWGPDHAPGAAFDAWAAAIRVWGYEHRVVYLDSAHAQALGPGSCSRRGRMYVVFWRTGDRPPDFEAWLRPAAHCPVHGQVRAVQAWKTTKMCSPQRPWGVYGPRHGQYVYRCPRTECRNQMATPAERAGLEALDLTLPAPRIGERPRGLRPATLAKIRDGWNTYTAQHPGQAHGSDGALPAPFVVELRGGGSTHRPAAEPLSTVTAGGVHHGVVYTDAHRHALLPYYGNSRTRPVSQPIPTLTTRDRHALLAYAPTLADCRYRMLSVPENAAAMEFPTGYRWLANRDQTIAMIGNAVTPPAARDLIAMTTHALTGQAPQPAGGTP